MKMHSEIIEAEDNLEGSIIEATHSKALGAEAMLAETKRRRGRRREALYALAPPVKDPEELYNLLSNYAGLNRVVYIGRRGNAAPSKNLREVPT